MNRKAMKLLAVVSISMVIASCMSPAPPTAICLVYLDHGKMSDFIELGFLTSSGDELDGISVDTLYSREKNEYYAFLNNASQYSGDSVFPRVTISTGGRTESIVLPAVMMKENVSCEIDVHRFWQENRTRFIGDAYMRIDFPDSVEGENGQTDSLAVSVICDR